MESGTGESAFYNFFRRCLRFWFSLLFRRLRTLHGAPMPASGEVLFVVNHPPGFAEMLLLTAALERRVHCVIHQSLLKGAFQRLAARALGMIPYGLADEDWPAALESACRIFSQGGAVLIFARQRQPEGSEGFAPEAAEVALEAEAYLGREAPLPVVPVHLFLPVPPSGAGEVLVFVDIPLSTHGARWRDGENLEKGIRLLDQEIEKACGQSPFRLQPDVVDEFLNGLESLLREDFAEKWSHRENWKQKVEDFDLSPFVVRLAHQLNYSHPGRLAALNGALRNYEERKRRAALDAFIGGAAGDWVRTPWRRLLVWTETAIGFPVACYGLANLLIAWFVMWLAGLLKNGLWSATAGEWAWRVLVALVCYAGEIALAAHFLPRAQAGIYAPSVFVSGAYLLRYIWLLQHRTSVLVSAGWGPKRLVKIRRLRSLLIQELKQDQDRYASAWKIAH